MSLTARQLIACVAAGPRTRLNPLYRFRASATQARQLKVMLRLVNSKFYSTVGDKAKVQILKGILY